MFTRKLKLTIRKLQLCFKYYSFLPPRKNEDRYLVFMLNNVIMHGGLLDRIKGIISASVVAKATGYGLKIYIDQKTFNLFKFLVPVNASIVTLDDDMVYNVWHSEPVLLYNLPSVTKGDIINLFNKKKGQYHFYCNLDLLKQFYPGETAAGLNTIWRNTFNHLFTFDKYFVDYAAKVYGGAEKICGIHLRFLSLLGDFAELVINILPEDEQKALVSKCTDRVTSIIAEGAYEKYLVVSDSVIFLQTLQGIISGTVYAERVIILDGTIAHIDNNHSEDVLQKAILDFYLLSKCSFVYQVIANKMHNSQFCRYAAVLGNATYRIDKI